MTIAAIPLWFELFQIVVARTRLGQALRCAEPGSDQECGSASRSATRLVHRPRERRYRTDLRRALEIAERIGATAVRTQALWGCGPHAAAAAIIPPRSKGAPIADVAENTGDIAPCTLRTAS